jgi:hypothetical protein
LLATDPTDAGFNLYRSTSGGAGMKLNSQVITNTTDFLDTTANFTVSNAWYVVPVIGGVEQAPGAPASPVEYHCPPAREMCQPLLHGASLAANSPVRQYLPLPLHAVTGGGAPPYDVKFCWVGDFDGDGEYDYLVDRLSTTTATNQFLQAYKRDGTLLWQMDMGYNSVNQYNIEPGAPRGVNTGTTPGLATTSTPRGASAISIGDKDNITVYDLDGDGKAEVIECLRQWPRDGRARTASVTDATEDSNQSPANSTPFDIRPKDFFAKRPRNPTEGLP